MGVHTVSIVRRPELVDELKKLGADVVLVEGPDLAKRVREATDKAKIMLALDCVGGPVWNAWSTTALQTAGHWYCLWRDERRPPGIFFIAPNIFR